MKTLEIKPFYNTVVNDVLNEFYIPILNKTKIYKRVSAYFDSNIISLYSKGIENIVRNDGHIYFLFSSELSEKDFNLIKESYEFREKYFELLKNKIITDYPSSELKNLGYLIKNFFVDIKIAFLKANSLFHDKFGLFENNNDIVYFRGSNNETVASIKSNFEAFETTCSWSTNEHEKEKINQAKEFFNKLWENKFSEEIIVYEIPDVIKNQLISYGSKQLIYNTEQYENILILDYHDEFTIDNKLNNKNLISPKFIFFKIYIESHIKKIDGDKFIFKKDLSYIFIKKIISDLYDYAIKKNFFIFKTPELENFLLKSDLHLNERHSLGIAIKEQKNILNSKFGNFCKIVNEKMERKLKTFQLWHSYHIVEMFRSANFSVPGAGKTAIVYGAFAYLEAIQKVDKIIVIGPINCFNSWKTEFKKCFGEKKQLSVFDYQKEKIDGKNTILKIISSKDNNLILFNYESIPTIELVLKNLINSKTLLVFDEVHKIKSIDGIRSTSAKKIGNNSIYRIVLTGTPIPNGYIDLYNMLNLLFKDEYDSFFNFNQEFLRNAQMSVEKQHVLNNALYPFFCRLNKEDLNIPKVEADNIINCKLTQNEKKLFEIIFREFNKNSLTLFLRLIQASNNPKLILQNIKKDDIEVFNYKDEENDFLNQKNDLQQLNSEDYKFIQSFDMTSKFEKGIDLAFNLAKKGKVIIWAIFIDTINKIKARLLEKKLRVEKITGSDLIDSRDKILNKFINGDVEVLITNPHTLAESISLHEVCHQAIYFEYSFNLVHMLQSRDRIHRLGLKENTKTNYYYLQYEEGECPYQPIDKKIYLRLLEKEKIQSKVINNKEISYFEEDIEEDLNKLFGDLSE